MNEELSIERFRNVTTMIRYHNDKMVEAFARFVRFSALIVAGSFYVFLEGTESHGLIGVVTCMAPMLIVFVAISSAAVIASNWCSWFGFRKAESNLLEGAVQPPKFWRSAKEQLIMVAIMFAVSCFATWLYLCVLKEKVL